MTGFGSGGWYFGWWGATFIGSVTAGGGPFALYPGMEFGGHSSPWHGIFPVLYYYSDDLSERGLSILA